MIRHQMKSDQIQGLHQQNLRDKEYLYALKGYKDFLLCHYGPQGNSTFILNSAGNDNLTSSSSKLLQQLPFSHPSVKYINALIAAQNNTYGSFGLYTGILCCDLLFKALNCEEDYFRIFCQTSDWLMEILLKKLNEKESNLVEKLDFASLEQVVNFVSNILGSKGNLTKADLSNLSLNVVEAFLKTIPSSTHKYKQFGKVHIIHTEGSSNLLANLSPGILYSNSLISDGFNEHCTFKFPCTNARILLFNIPISNVTDKEIIINWKANLPLDFSVADYYITLLKKVLIQWNVQLVASQMFIHPKVKFELEREGFLVLERLGTNLTHSLIEATGCCPLSSFQHLEEIMSENVIGILDNVEEISVANKTYLKLGISTSEHVTLLLNEKCGHKSEFLKESIESCLDILRMSVQDPRVVPGAGCLESWCVRALTELKARECYSFSKQINASAVGVSKVLDVFIKSFAQLSVFPSMGSAGTTVDFSVDLLSGHSMQEIPEGEAQASSEPTSSHKNEISLIENASHFVGSRCACKKLKITAGSMSMLVPLKTLIESDPIFLDKLLNYKPMNCAISSNSNETGHENQEQGGFAANSELLDEFAHDCILDYMPAKVNAIKLAFQGFAELYRVGVCIYDR